MRKTSILLALLFCVICKLSAQSPQVEKPYRIGASLGYSFTGYKEETYSTVNRYLNTLTFILDGNIEKGKFLHSFNLGFFMGDSETKNETEAVLFRNFDPQKGEAYYRAYLPQYKFIRPYLEYALDYRLWGNDTFPGYFGGAFRADAYMQFANHPSITAILSLAAHASQKWLINSENSLTLSVGLPLFGYAVRPAFAGADGAMIKYIEESPLKVVTLGEVVSLHNYWALFGDLKYQHKVNTLLSLYSGLGFEVSRINFPRPRIDSILRLNAGIAFTF